MKFSQIPYTRVELAPTKAQAEALTAALTAATDYATAKAVFTQWQTLSSAITTASSLAMVRHTIDTNDDFYNGEKDYYDEASPIFQEMEQDFSKALLSSPYRAEFEQEFGVLFIKNAEIALGIFSPAIIADLQEENRVESEYVKLMASAQIDFQGQQLTLSQLTPYMQSQDRGTRLAAWAANGSFFDQHKEAWDSLYDKLTAIRTKIGRTLGHENFIPTGYDRMVRNSYTEADVDKFRQGVRDYIVPVAARLKQEQAQRIGVDYPMLYSDDPVLFAGGNAAPFGTPEEIMAHGQKMYHEMSAESGTFIDFMVQNELFDILSRKGKAGGGYCTTFPDYNCPFIFANFNGTAHDVEVITHEAGHAFAEYVARDIYPRENRNPTLESCEIHSMSMEFFAWPWCEGFFGKDTQKFYYQHLAGALTFLPYGTMVDHFQHEIYKNPDMTPAQRHKVWAELEKIYRPWIKDSDTTFYREGRYWQRQHHIYEMPFYYIDYCLAQTVALQFWAAMQTDRTDAWKRYMHLLSQAGTMTFDQLVACADMASPFGGTALKDVADTALAWLDGFDRTALI